MKKNNSNITAFSEKLVTLISAESQEERNKLLDAFRKAQKKYVGSNSFFSWVCMKSRQSELTETISVLSSASSPLTRLREVERFISTGGWETNSANTLVLDFLTKATNSDENYFDLIELKEKVLEGIQSKIETLNYPISMMTKKNYAELYKSYKDEQKSEKTSREEKRKTYNHNLDQLLFNRKKENIPQDSIVVLEKRKLTETVITTESFEYTQHSC